MPHTGAEIYEMNKSYPWSGCIINAYSIKDSQEFYKLHTTGGCELGCGRIYKALPSDLELTEDVIKKHNLMIPKFHLRRSRTLSVSSDDEEDEEEAEPQEAEPQEAEVVQEAEPQDNDTHSIVSTTSTEFKEDETRDPVLIPSD